MKNESQKELIKKNKHILLGNAASNKSSNAENQDFDKFLELNARIVHVRNIPGIQTRHQNIDVVVIRENLEGEYSGIEHEVTTGVFESVKVCTKTNAQKIANYAFEYAHLAGRKKVTAVHKANIMKKVDGLFLEATREVSKKYPHIQYDEIIIDNCAM